MSNNTQSMLFLASHAPYGSSLPAAGLDLMLTAAAFDQDITLAFCDDGIYQLLKEQDSKAINAKAISKTFPALELYDVNNILVEHSALLSRGIQEKDLVIPVKLVSTEELAALLEKSDQVFSF